MLHAGIYKFHVSVNPGNPWVISRKEITFPNTDFTYFQDSTLVPVSTLIACANMCSQEAQEYYILLAYN